MAKVDTGYRRRHGVNRLSGACARGAKIARHEIQIPEGMIGILPIDGNPRSGKGTMADILREEGIAVLDTGQGYRSATYHFLPMYRNHIGAEAYDNFLQSIANCTEEERTLLVSDTNQRLEDWIREGIEEGGFASLVATIQPDSLGRWSIDGAVIPTPDISLYAPDVTNFVSVFARQSEFRGHFNEVTTSFIRTQHALGKKFVGTDGRSERQIIAESTSIGVLQDIGRLAAAFFFEVDYIEAARRDLMRRTTSVAVRDELLSLEQNTLPDNLLLCDELLALAEVFKQRDASDRTRESNPMSVGNPEVNLSNVFATSEFTADQAVHITNGSSIYVDTTGVSYEDSCYVIRRTLGALGIISAPW